MSEGTVVETVYGKYCKYEVVKKPGGVFTSAQFFIRKDGKPHKGPYGSLRDAVRAAEKESGDQR